MNHRTWIELSSFAFHTNIAHLARAAAPAKVGIVVKGNAYGHGLAHIGTLAERNAHIAWLYTASIEEALELRVHGFTKKILVMSHLIGDIAAAIVHNIELTVWDLESAQLVQQEAQRINRRAHIQLKLDTGLNRIGFTTQSLMHEIQSIAQYPDLAITGAFTHLADAASVDETYSGQQLALFEQQCQALREVGIGLPHVHALASASLPIKRQDSCVRIGTSAYGFWKNDLHRERLAAKVPGITLVPVMTWKSRIVQIKEIPAGAYVGYNRTFQAPHQMRIAVLPIGYWDGYPRSLSNKGVVYIGNQSARVIGIVSMNLMTIDITHLPHVRTNEIVTLLGTSSEISASTLAAQGQTIQNEIITRIHAAIPRVII